MKVILLQNVAKIGNKGDVKEVNQGYANNFLLPKKLARSANDKDVKEALRVKEESKVHQKVKEELTVKLFQDLKGKSVTISEKTNDKGHLFSKVHIPEISKAIKDQIHFDINESWIILNDPIKEVGEHDVEIKHDKLSAKIKVVIEEEK